MGLTPDHKPSLSLWTVLLFSVLIGLMATLWGYRYGDGNQIEQLPIVMRAVNPAYLTNDFFTNATQDFGPRALFADFVAWLARTVTALRGQVPASQGQLALPGVYLGLTILANAAIAFITARFGRDLFEGSDMAGLVSAAAVMTLKSFWLGYSNIIYDYFLEPAHLAMPFILLAIWAGLRQRPVACILAAGIATLVHPLMGLETGALMLGVMAVNAVRLKFFGVRPSLKGDCTRSSWVRLGLSGLAFGGFAALILAPYAMEKQIDASLFIQILAFFRHPHHYVPSSFGGWQYLQALVFLIPAGIAWFYGMKRAARLRSLTFPMLALAAFLGLLCLGGYLFVEVFPSRLWTTAQTFRLLFMVKWLGLVVTAGWVGAQLETSREGGFWPFVLLASLVSQVTLFLAFGVHLLRDWTRQRLPAARPLLMDGPVLLVMVPLLLVFPPDAHIYILFPLFSLMALCLFYWRRRWLAIGVNLILTAAVVAVLLAGNRFLPASALALADRPVITLSQLSGDDIDVAAFAQANTPADAIFLTPPNLGEFRYTAERAIVVDFDAFPFQDQAMAEWQQRIFDCYGVPTLKGFDAEPEMRDHYTAITQADIVRLQVKYGFTYAVLYRSTPTSFPVLYQNTTYMLIRIK
jgi:hypothetical protein